MSDEAKQLQERMKVVQFGIDVENFFRSDIGRYLATRAEQERTELVEQLIVTDPDDTKKVRKIQNQIVVIDNWQTWLAEAIQEGNNTANTLINEEAEAGG